MVGQKLQDPHEAKAGSRGRLGVLHYGGPPDLRVVHINKEIQGHLDSL